MSVMLTARRGAMVKKNVRNFLPCALALFICLGAAQAFAQDLESVLFNDYVEKGLMLGDPISAANGTYRFRVPLLDLGGPLPLKFELIYQSDFSHVSTGSPKDVPSAYWWTPKCAARFLDYSGMELFKAQVENGNKVAFKKIDDAWVLTEAADFPDIPDDASPVPYQLKETDDYMYLMDPLRQVVYIFHKYSSGDISVRIAWIMDRNGNTLSYTYEVPSYQRNPWKIEDGLGRQLTFDYGSYYLDSVTDQAGRTVSFTNSQPVFPMDDRTLDSVTDAADAVTNFTTVTKGVIISFQHQVTEVTRPEGNTPYTQIYDVRDMNGLNASRVYSQTDAYGNKTKMGYTAHSKEVTATRPDESVVVYEHHSYHGLPQKLTDATGKTVSFAKTDDERISEVVDRLGDATSMTWHEGTGNIETFIDAEGRTTTWSYTLQSRTVANPGNAEEVQFDFHNMTGIDYPDGTNVRMAYDSKGNMTELTDRRGKQWGFSYNGRGQVETVENPEGGVVSFAYNADGTVDTRTDSDTGATTFSYDAAKRPVAAVHPDGTRQEFVYDENDRVTSVTSCDNQGPCDPDTDENDIEYSYAYDANGNLTEITDPEGNVASFEYDLMDRLTGSTDRFSKTVEYAYDSMDRLSSFTDPNGLETTFGYDVRGWPDSTTAGGQTWTVGYDDEGVPSSLTTPLGNTSTFETDKLGRMTGVADPLGNETLIARDGQGRITGICDPEGRTVSYAYEGGGLLAKTTAPVIGTFEFFRNDSGLPTRIADPMGNFWDFEYSPMGRAAATQNPLAHRWEYGYDQMGRSASVTYPDDSTLAWSYDSRGNIASKQWSDGTTFRYEYDRFGRLSDGDGIELVYDAEGRVVATTIDSAAFGATYDDGGRLRTVGYFDGTFSVTYEYDAVTGLLSRVSDSLVFAWVEFSYDDDFRLTAMTRANGADTEMSWNEAGWLSRIRHYDGDGDVADLRYSHNKAGQIVRIDMDVPLDPSQFPSAGDGYDYDAACRLTGEGYSFDDRGRMTASPGRAYSWNGASHLTEIDGVLLAYDGLGNLSTRSENGTVVEFFHNLAVGTGRIMAERDQASGELRRAYVWTPSGRLLYMIDLSSETKSRNGGGGSVYYYHFDHVGSTLALTDASGEVAAAYAYDPYGKLLGETGSIEQPFAFAGQWGVRREGDGVLYQMGQRYYHAGLKRFLSIDPVWPDISDPLLANPYQYAAFDPAGKIDPSGRRYDPNFYRKYSTEELEAFIKEDREIISNNQRQRDDISFHVHLIRGGERERRLEAQMKRLLEEAECRGRGIREMEKELERRKKEQREAAEKLEALREKYFYDPYMEYYLSIPSEGEPVWVELKMDSIQSRSELKRMLGALPEGTRLEVGGIRGPKPEQYDF